MTHLALPAPRVGVLGDTIPGDRVRDAALVLAGAGLTALGAQISIATDASPVPITGQTLGVVVAGAALGASRGVLSQMLYVLAGLFLPVYSGGDSGFHVIWGPSGGYLVGFVLAAWVIGRLAEHGADRRPVRATVAFALAQLSVFVIGVPWLKVATDIDWGTAVHEGFTVFIIGGLIKAALAGVLAPAAWRLVRRIDRG
jgi:biotin transport system substrate-specific component